MDECKPLPYTLTGWSHDRSAMTTPASPVDGLVLRRSTQSHTWHQNGGPAGVCQHYFRHNRQIENSCASLGTWSA